MPANLSVLGYGFAGLAFLTLTILLVTSWQGRLNGAVLTVAAAVSAIWGIALATPFGDPLTAELVVFLSEILRNTFWLVFLSILFAGGAGAGPGHRVLIYGGPVLSGLVLLAGLGLHMAERAGFSMPGLAEAQILGALSQSLFALILLEQIYRNARSQQRSSLKFLCIGLLTLFSYDLILYSHWILFSQLDPLLWGVRGFVATLCVPLIAVSAQRNPTWSVGIFVSRQVVFYTATLIGAGVYLLSMAAIGYYIRYFGGAWGPAAQIVFFVAAILILTLILFSDRLRARARVFLSKHFFRNRYDYREEWLRLMQTLASASEPGLPLGKRAIKALCDILGTHAGLLYLRQAGETRFQCDSGWNIRAPDRWLVADAPLVRFLEDSGWIVDTVEYSREPELYRSLEQDLSELGLEQPGYIVPLMNDEYLLGFVVLGRRSVDRDLNFEDRDLLKTAGRQIAGYLDQEQKKFQLAEVRQFETFNRLTAFLMHDLKNLIAQQSLVVDNAQKHKDKPEFVDDAIATVKSGVFRMRKVLEQLSQGAPIQSANKIELGKLVLEATSRCADRQPEPETEAGESRLWVRADRERLLMALVHAIRNAQDATPADGSVTVALDTDGTHCRVRIRDTGVGMDNSFVEERLFKPFDSTKGAQGMGIGAYQIRETLRAFGGYVDVESVPGAGTCFSLMLPDAGPPQ